jgi:hypothetical protein
MEGRKKKGGGGYYRMREIRECGKGREERWFVVVVRMRLEGRGNNPGGK